MKTYKGRYKPSNPSKYVGDIDNVVYRSGWERHVMKWCDNNPDVEQWMSEELIIPYICETDKKPHRYFMDFVIKYRSGRVTLVEVKPEKETKRPERTQGKSRQRLLSEGLTYVKNQSKWKACIRIRKGSGIPLRDLDRERTHRNGHHAQVDATHAY